jgi:hypothetical protein
MKLFHKLEQIQGYDTVHTGTWAPMFQSEGFSQRGVILVSLRQQFPCKHCAHRLHQLSLDMSTKGTHRARRRAIGQ